MLPRRTLRHRDLSSERVGFYHRQRTRDGRLQYSVSFRPVRGHSSSASSSSFSSKPDSTQLHPSSSQVSFPNQNQENISSEAEGGIAGTSQIRISRPDVADVIGSLLGFDTSSAVRAGNNPIAPSRSASTSNRSDSHQRPEHLSSSEADTGPSGLPRPTPPSGAESYSQQPSSTHSRTSTSRMSRSSSNSDNNATFTPSHSSSRRARSPSRVFSIFGRRGRRSRTNSDSSSYAGADDIMVGASVPAYIRNGTGWENMPPPYEYVSPGMTTTGAQYSIANIPAHIYVLQPQQPTPTGSATPTANAPGFPGQPLASQTAHQTSHGFQRAPGHTFSNIYPAGVHLNTVPSLLSTPATGFVAPLESQAFSSAASSENEPVHPVMRTIRRTGAANRLDRRHRGSGGNSPGERHGPSSNQKVKLPHSDNQVDGRKHSRQTFPENMQDKHICNGCGRVRSRKFHDANPIRPGKKAIPNFCRKCRDAFMRDDDAGDFADENESGTAVYTKTTKKKKRSTIWIPSDTSFVGSIATSVQEAPKAKNFARTSNNSDSEDTFMAQSQKCQQGSSAASSNIFETSKKFRDAFSAIAEGKARSRSRRDKPARVKGSRAEDSNASKRHGYQPPTVESVVDSSEESSAVPFEMPQFCRKRGYRHGCDYAQKFSSPRHFSDPEGESQPSDSPVNGRSGGAPRQSCFPSCSAVSDCCSVSDPYGFEPNRQFNGVVERVVCNMEDDPFVDKAKYQSDRQGNRMFESKQLPGSLYGGQKRTHHAPKAFSVRTASSAAASGNVVPSLPVVDERQDDELKSWLFGNKKAADLLHESMRGSPPDTNIYGDDHVEASPSKEGIPAYNFDLFSEESLRPETPVTARMVFGNENENPFAEGKPADPENTVIPDYNFDLFSEVSRSGKDFGGHGGPLSDIGVPVAALSELDDNAAYSPIESSYFPIGRKGTPDFESYAVTLPSENSSAMNDSSSDLSKRRDLDAVRCTTPGSILRRAVKANRSSLSQCPSLEVTEYNEEGDKADIGEVIRHIVECEVISNPTDSECGHSARLVAAPDTPVPRLLL